MGLSPATKPLESVAVDLRSPLTGTKLAYRFLLVIADRFKKPTQVVPHQTQHQTRHRKGFLISLGPQVWEAEEMLLGQRTAVSVEALTELMLRSGSRQHLHVGLAP